jgi:polysaccharide biosynthesis/export protein
MRIQTLTNAVTVLVLSLVVCFGHAQANDKKEPAKPAVAASQAVPANDNTYVIGAEDVINVNVWKEPDVSGSVPVRPDGKISMPLLNDVQAAGLTPMQLTNELTEKLKQYISDPRVTVTVTTVNSRRVYVLGEVTRPGAVTLAPNMTVLQALTSAGGPTEYAKKSKIYVLRTENGAQNKLPFNYKEVVKGSSTEQNIVLKPGDTIVVP